MSGDEDLILEFENIRTGLAPAYQDYCLRVSPQSHALSMETCVFASWLCSVRHATSPADFGSGFSSYALRRCVEQVTSVDNDKNWLDKTGEFLRRFDTPDAGLMLWDEWLASGRTHDLIVYDFASGETREAGMPVVAERLAPGGMILFDDSHHESHHRVMVATCRDFDLDILDVHDATVDLFGRFALAAVKR